MTDIPDEVIGRIRREAGLAVDRQANDYLDELYRDACSWYHGATGAQMIFARESGYHTGGWWKNPDYERCYHLSLSFRAPTLTSMPLHLSKPKIMASLGFVKAARPFDWKAARRWIRALFGDAERLLWHEPPFTDTGKQLDVHHFRLFCDEGWQPFKPRGEVYTRDFTAAGWQSYSDLQAARAKGRGDG